MSLDLTKLTNLKVTPTGWTARCPACAAQNGDKKGEHLGIQRSGKYHCVVGSHSDANHNRNIRALVRGDGALDVEYIDPEPLLTAEKVYPESMLNSLLPDVSYWVGRGMRESVVRRLECGLSPNGEKGQLKGRTIFPVRDLRGRIMGFAGRLVISNSFAPKWKNLVKTSKTVYPWNITGPAIKRTKTAVLVESVGDLLACLSHDIEPVLCIFGLNLNSRIISTLVGADVRRVIVSLNRDEDERKGQAAATRISVKLEPFFPRVEVRLPESKDWGKAAEGGEAGAAELARFRAEVES